MFVRLLLSVIIVNIVVLLIFKYFGKVDFFRTCFWFNVLKIYLSLSNIYCIYFYGDFVIFQWCKIQNFVIDLSLKVSPLTSIRTFCVVLISARIQYYSFHYIGTEPHKRRFLVYIELFSFFILIIINRANFFVFFLGWEGIGIISFLLISFWTTRIFAVKSALIALLINKVGDISLLCRIGYVYNSIGTLDFDKLGLLGTRLDPSLVLKINLFLIIRIIRKSAQIGFYAWLVNAIEGPTPVSALLHSATIVTAGVFLLFKCNILVNLNQMSLYLLIIIGLLTTFFSSIIATVENDLKKIIAFSTCGHLGIMILFIGLGQRNLRFYHFIVHAFHKTILFLGRGQVIHFLNNEQDTRKRYAVGNFLPLVSICRNFSSLTLLGFPFFRIMYTKESLFLLFSSIPNLFRSTAGSILLLFSFIFITSYTYNIIKIFFYFGSPYRPLVSRSKYCNLKKINPKLVYVFVVLGLVGLVSGVRVNDMCTLNRQVWFPEFTVNTGRLIIIEILPWYLKVIPWLFILGGTCTFVYYAGDNVSYFKNLNSNFLNNKIRKNILEWVMCVFKNIEKGWLLVFVKVWDWFIFFIQRVRQLAISGNALLIFSSFFRVMYVIYFDIDGFSSDRLYMVVT